MLAVVMVVMGHAGLRTPIVAHADETRHGGVLFPPDANPVVHSRVMAARSGQRKAAERCCG